MNLTVRISLLVDDWRLSAGDRYCVMKSGVKLYGACVPVGPLGYSRGD